MLKSDIETLRDQLDKLRQEVQEYRDDILNRLENQPVQVQVIEQTPAETPTPTATPKEITQNIVVRS